MIDREKYLERQRRYNRSDKGRARGLRYNHTVHGGCVRSAWALSWRIHNPGKAFLKDIRDSTARRLRRRSELYGDRVTEREAQKT